MQLSRRFPAPSLFRRCVECPPEIPSCPPTCPQGETCLLQSESCDDCASAKCVKIGSVPGQSEPKKSSPVPAIAGGVAGGVVFIIVVIFLIWWFFIRKRRQEWDEQVWTDTDQSIKEVEKRDQSGLNREARESTRSMGSIASTAHTRASNVIQIAYIPGVTNRSPTESPGLLVPAVPTIPMRSKASSAPTSPNFEQDRHFFMPNDLRDSTYSEQSGRQSLSPSLATTIYRNHAQVSPRPAQQALRAKAAVVNVNVNKSGNNTPEDSGTPQDAAAPPMIPQSQKGIISSPIVARNVTARPIQVKKSDSGKKTQVPTLANLQAAAANGRVDSSAQSGRAEDEAEDETDPTAHLMATVREHHQSAAATIIDDTPAVKQTQFTNTGSSSSSSVSERLPLAAAPRGLVQRPSPAGSRSSVSSGMPVSASSRKHKKNGSLNSLIEEAMSRASREPRHGGLGSISESHNHPQNHPTSQGLGSGSGSRDGGGNGNGNGNRGQTRSDSPSAGSGPFSDANELKESGSASS